MENYDKPSSEQAGGQAQGEDAQQVETPGLRLEDQGRIMERLAINILAEVTNENVNP